MDERRRIDVPMTALKPQATDYLALDEIRPQHAEVSQNLDRLRNQPLNLDDPQRPPNLQIPVLEPPVPLLEPRTLYEIARESLPGTPAQQDELEMRYVRRNTRGEQRLRRSQILQRVVDRYAETSPDFVPF